MKSHFAVALFFLCAIWTPGSGGGQNPAAASARYSEPADVAAFRANVGGSITPVIVELKGDPTVLQKVAGERAGKTFPVEELAQRSLGLVARQDEFLASLYLRNVRALLKAADVPQIDGSIRHIEWRFTYLLNGFVLYVADGDIERLQEQPEVQSVEVVEPVQFHLNKAIDYSLGTMPAPADRRLAVYGATQELSPVGSSGHLETPGTTAIDGFEGQDINLAVIDTGVDWRHPMFGGIGQATPRPRVSGNAPSPSDNTKVIYYYSLSSPGDPTDDFGHGTLVASTAAGFKVDGNTPAQLGFGTGRDGTGIGPTIDGATLHGTAPQARILVYKVCGPANACSGDIPLAIEDAASPFTLVASGGNQGPTPVAKPVADVINLSLGSTAGNPASASSRAVNNAALAGTIVVASAGNSGPGLGTVGDSSVATLNISVAASLDPGSTAVGDVLAAGQIPGETSAGKTPTEGAVAGPAKETGAVSDANASQAGERQAMTLFTAAGGGLIPGGSVSAHYVFVDQLNNQDPPVTVTNRIAIVKFTGTFAAAANRVAGLNPAGILLITTVESATAVAVVNSIPTYTIGPANGNYLIDLMRSGDLGDGNNAVDVPHGTVSQFPLRLAESATLASFNPAMAGFSSRGPNDHPAGGFRTVKPDVSGPGVGIAGAATPEGIPDETIGLASTSGYTQANGTSFSAPITAGAMVLIRQRVRNELGLDTTSQGDPNYRNKRFDTVTVARALLQNNATNLRSGLGVPTADGAVAAAINEMGAGHINVAAALDAKAIMVSPTLLLKDADPAASGDQREFNAPTRNPPTLVDGNLEVLIPTASFGPVPVVGVDGVLKKKQKVIVRDVTNGQGGGTYNLTFQDNRNANHPGFDISFLAADGVTPTTSVIVPSGGTAEFFVQAAADGNQILIPEFEFQWYVTATQAGSGRALRMPFYYRAVAPVVQNITAPVQGAPTDIETPASDPACGTDTNGNYTLNFSYTRPAGGPAPVGFRVQEGTVSQQGFFDNADEPLVNGANSRWAGSAQWTTQVNPETGSPAYFAPDTANQNESLTMIGAVVIPQGGSTLAFDTNQDLETNFDFGYVEGSVDGGLSYGRLGAFTGAFVGTRQFDLSGFAGSSVKLRFRITSDLVVSAPGWYIENIRISSDDFQTIANTAASATSLALAKLAEATYFYRIAGIFSTPDGNVVGPYSSTKCIKVDFPNVVPVANAGADFAIDEGQSAMLSGAGSSDPDGGVLSYAWEQTEGPAVTLNGANTATPNFIAPSVSTDTPLTFQLTVTDAESATHADEIVVTVRNVNLPPVANAGQDFAINEGESAMLSGALSSDPDGETLTYSWTQTLGPKVVLQPNANAATPSFTAPSVDTDTALRFVLTVRDPAGAQHSDDITVTVRDVPTLTGDTKILGGALPSLSLLVLGLLGALGQRRKSATG